MKVIGVDNFNRDYIDDVLIAEGLTEEEANLKATALNAVGDDYAPIYYRAVPDDYQLFKFEV